MFPVEGSVGKGSFLRVDGQRGYFSHKEGTTSWFHVPPLDFDEEEVAIPISSNKKHRRNFINIFKRKNYEFEYISDTGSDGELAFDRKWRERYSSDADECYVGIKLVTESALMQLRSIKLVLPSERNGIKPEDFNGVRF